jgi:MoxR-like ATPase
MEEQQVTVGGVAMALPRPFMVVATQNPVDFAGTYPLPESQLDRFLICMRIGYPDAETERNVLKQESSGRSAPALERILLAHRFVEMIETARQVMVKDELYDFVVHVLACTRADDGVRLGASPRAGIALIRAARVRAASLARHYVIPADVEALAVPVLAHRLVLDPSAEFNGVTAERVVQRAVGAVRPSL